MSDNEQLIEHLKYNTGVLSDPNLEEALRTVDRKDFILPDYEVEAYEDYPLPIGSGQTISQPTVVALMLERLAVEPGQSVLDVGSGSGWTTGLLAYLVTPNGRVIGTERLPELIELGRSNLKRYNIDWAEITGPDQITGRFDRILVSAALQDMDQIKEEFQELLADNGRLVASVADTVVTAGVNEGQLRQLESLSGFKFVPYVK